MALCQTVVRTEPALLAGCLGSSRRSANTCSLQRDLYRRKAKDSRVLSRFHPQDEGPRVRRELGWSRRGGVHVGSMRGHQQPCLLSRTDCGGCCHCSSRRVSAPPLSLSGPSGWVSCAPSWLLRGLSSCRCSSGSARYRCPVCTALSRAGPGPPSLSPVLVLRTSTGPPEHSHACPREPRRPRPLRVSPPRRSWEGVVV